MRIERREREEGREERIQLGACSRGSAQLRMKIRRLGRREKMESWVGEVEEGGGEEEATRADEAAKADEEAVEGKEEEEARDPAGVGEDKGP